MGAVVLPHVNQFAGLAHGLESRLDHSFRLAHKGDHRAVGGLARVDIQQPYAVGRLNLACYLLYYSRRR